MVSGVRYGGWGWGVVSGVRYGGWGVVSGVRCSEWGVVSGGGGWFAGGG